MTKVVMQKLGAALVPVDQQGVDLLAKLKTGQDVTVEVKRARNLGFHRKFYALLNLAYDAWEPEEATYNGERVQKNFEQFRNDIIVLAGFRDVTITMKGEVRVVAKSISFASMSQDDFEAMYSKVIDVTLSRILTNYTREDIDTIVERVLSFT